MKLCMIVTADSLELPIAVGTTNECAKMMGVLPHSLSAMLSPSHQSRYEDRHNAGWKAIRVEI